MMMGSRSGGKGSSSNGKGSSSSGDGKGSSSSSDGKGSSSSSDGKGGSSSSDGKGSSSSSDGKGSSSSSGKGGSSDGKGSSASNGKGSRFSFGMGKGDRRRTFELDANDDQVMYIDTLSSVEKDLLLDTLEQGDDDAVNVIFDRSRNENPGMAMFSSDGGIHQPTSRELFLNLCGLKIGRLFKKCRDDDEDYGKGGGGGKGGGMGMGKRGRRRRTFEGFANDDLLMLVDSLSLDDKKKLLIAMEEDNDGAVDTIFDRYY